ncbi:MAG: pre-peptidase C-terminal domain-containing protein [bacterium]|nr:pre-peptidase C-terminal domain-containing protein [bacterium]
MLRKLIKARRTVTLHRVFLVGVIALVGMLALAQSSRTLSSGIPVIGTLNADTPAQIYTFTASEGDRASLAAATSDGMALTILLTDAEGNVIAQNTDTLDSGQAVIPGTELPASGTYYVTVFIAAGLESSAEGEFTVTLLLTPATQSGAQGGQTEPLEPTEDAETTAQPEATTQPEVTAEATVAVTPTPAAVTPETFSIGQTILSNGGIEINLRWNSSDDLNLQVRDPSGETLFWDSRTTTNGGTFGFDVNGLCEVVTATDNVETASWPTGPVVTGSYEILVYYRQACVGSTPVDFSLDVTVDGVALPTVTGNVAPPLPGTDSVFITSFDLSEDGTAQLREGGPYIDTRVLDVPVADLLEQEAQPLTLETPVRGVITSEQAYQTYRYNGTSGDTISVSVSRETGSLDTLLLVLDSAGNVVDGNDDVEVAVNTNSAINLLLLPATDTYTIVVTRYGKLVGGTEGTYNLLVSGQSNLVLPQQVVDLALPQGDIQITLTWNTAADLRLLVRDPALNSVFNDEPTSPTGGRLQAVGNLNCNLATTPIPVSYIYWPQGLLRIGSYEVDVLHRSECNDPTPVQFNLYVSVLGQLVFTQSGTLTLGQRYLTSFNILDTAGETVFTDGGLIGDSSTIAYQDQLASAVSITPEQRVTGTITTENTFDLYTFDGQAGDVVTVSMGTTSGNLDTLLYLIGPSGIEIAANDDSNESTDSLIADILLTEEGTYTVIATRFGVNFGGTTGAYNLLLRVDAP